MPFMTLPDFPVKPRAFAFDRIMQILLSLFPHDISVKLEESPAMFERSEYVPVQMLQARIMTLQAIGAFFRSPEGYTQVHMVYIDKLFGAILDPGSHILMHLAVLQILLKDFAFTNRNRLRVEQTYRTALSTLKNSKNGTLMERPTSGGARNDFQPLVDLLISRIDKFASIWFPRPSDSQLIRLTGGDGVKDLNGYAKRRYAFLSAPSAAVGGKVVGVKDTIETRLVAYKKGYREPYSSSVTGNLDPSDYEYLSHFGRRKKRKGIPHDLTLRNWKSHC